MTLSELHDNIYRVLDRYSANSVITSKTDGLIGDIENRLIPAINAEIRKLNHLFVKKKKKTVLSFVLPELYRNGEDFELADDATDIFTLGAQAGCFSFVFRGSGSMEIFIDGVLTDTVSLEGNPSAFCGMKYSLPDGEDKYVIFTGDGLCVRELSAFRAKYAEDREKLIPTRKTLFADIPLDFAGISAVYSEDGKRCDRLVSLTDGCFAVRSCDAGEYLLEYYCTPQSFSEFSEEEQTIDLPPLLCDALTYAVAANVCPAEEAGLYSKLMFLCRDIEANYYTDICENREMRNTFFVCPARVGRI